VLPIEYGLYQLYLLAFLVSFSLQENLLYQEFLSERRHPLGAEQCLLNRSLDIPFYEALEQEVYQHFYR
jgi:hypothetical protein